MLFRNTVLARVVLPVVLALMFTPVSYVYSQTGVYAVKGVVADSADRKPMEFATVSVHDSLLKNPAVTYTGAGGEFTISFSQKTGGFLHVSFVGYQSKIIPVAIGEGPVTDIGTLYLSQDSRQLGDVTITGRRQLVEQKQGMLVYHAEKDVTNLGGSAADVLRKAPALSVDADGNVAMRGSRNLKILINGKHSGQMARSPADALSMIPADMIRSVEIITSPSSRYDAEGTAGVINIITKKTSERLNGALELAGGNLDLIFNPRAGFSSGKWIVNSYGHLHRSKVKKSTSFSRFPSDNTQQATSGQTADFNNARPHGMLDVTVDYEADSNNLVNFAASGWFGNWPVNSLTHNTSSGNDAGRRYYTQQTETNGAPNEGIDISLGYTRKFARPGQEFFVIGQYTNNFRDDFNYDTRHTGDEGTLLYRERNRNHLQTVEWTFQTDYIHPLFSGGKSALETGLKAILRKVGSDYSTWAADGGAGLLPVQERTDMFSYSQEVLAGYAQVRLGFDPGWTVQAGARFESTFLEGDFRSAASPFKNNFHNLVPNASVTRKWNDAHSFTLSYTQRISRPSILDLNPNVDARDSRNLVAGNPDLRPEASHQVELSHTLTAVSGFFLHTGLFGRRTANAIEDVVTVDDSGVSLSTRQNLAANSRYGANISASSGILPGWSWGSNAWIGYLDFQSKALNIDNKGWGWGLNLNTTCKFAGYYTAQVFGDYDSRVITLQGHNTDWFYYSLAVKREWPANGLTLGLTAINPFSAYAVRGSVWHGSGFTTDSRTRSYNRAVRLTVNWKFGESGRQVKRKSVRNDDLKSSSER